MQTMSVAAQSCNQVIPDILKIGMDSENVVHVIIYFSIYHDLKPVLSADVNATSAVVLLKYVLYEP